MYQERNKHIKVECHFVRETIIKGEIITPYVKSTKQLVDMVTRVVSKTIFSYLSSKFSMKTIYVLARGKVLKYIFRINFLAL